jgi:hypothetical protein
MNAFDALLSESLSPARVPYDAASRAWEEWLAAHPLPTNAALDARLAAPETRAGFVAVCRARGIFHLPTVEFVAALVALLRRLPGPYLEVGAGRGDLARAVRAAGVPLTGTDDGSWWPDGLPGDVACCAVATVVARYEPGTALCIWPPRGTNWPAQFRACPCVRAYLIIGADQRGMTGDAAAWAGAPGWRRTWLPRLAARSRCRLDAEGERHTRALLVRRWPPLPPERERGDSPREP